MAISNAILENLKKELNLIRLAKNYSYNEIMATDIGTKAQRKTLYGFSYLLSGINPKVQKSLGFGVVNIICHLSPANSSGFEVCQNRSDGCTKACLDTSGHGGIGDYSISPVHKARIARTRLLHTHPKIFLKILIQDIEFWQSKANKLGMQLAIRLNGTSDVIWETRFLSCSIGIRISNGTTTQNTKAHNDKPFLVTTLSHIHAVKKQLRTISNANWHMVATLR